MKPAQGENYRVCTRCVMDTSDPDIVFDENGVCNHCRSYFIRVENEYFADNPAALESLVSKIKEQGKNRKYDCITGVSGGSDSTYVVYLLKKLGLRPLVVHLDNGWNSELSVDNIERILKNVGFDFYTHVIDWDEFKDIQLSFLQASVVNAEIPTDHAINALLFKMAGKYKIKYIIGGGNISTEGINPPLAWAYYNQDLKHLKAVHRRFGHKSIKTLPTLSLFGFFSYVILQGKRVIPILNYTGYKKSEAMKIIEKELGWRNYGGKHYESIYTRFYQGYILYKKFGFDKRRVHFATLICSGDISREQALQELEKDPYSYNNLKEDLDFVIKKLGITQAEFEEIMNAPVKAHTEYPSDQFILEGMSKFRKVFKKIATKA